MARRLLPLLVVTGILLAPTVASAGAGTSQVDPITHVALNLALLLVVARLGGELAVRLGQPAVLGELIAGVALGNLTLVGVHDFENLATDPTIAGLAGLGVLILLFEVGLGSTVRDMLSVGATSLLVAVFGVGSSFALGWLAASWLLPQVGAYVHVFLGAMLTATSIGITARVLLDLGQSLTPEARVILGAAVIDDVLGLVVLAVVSGAIATASSRGGLSIGAVGLLLGKACLFLGGALALGGRLSLTVFRIGSRFRTRGALLAHGLAFCFFLSWISGLVGLAPMVGAFAAGLILEDVHLSEFKERGESGIEVLISPISSFLVPVFFLVAGMRTSLAVFSKLSTLEVAALLTLTAILGKQACAAGVLGKGIDRWTVALGMIPRGEVLLVFASFGEGHTFNGRPILTPATYSATVIVVILTTLVAPPALRWKIDRRRRRLVETPSVIP